MSRSISVVVPTYNRATLLAEALASIRQQTHPCTEIIVVDDGSTDQTEETMKSPPPGLRYVRQTNAGPAAARTTGMRLATSDFVALLDSDDLWVPDRLQRQMELLHSYPQLDVIFGLEGKFTGQTKAELCEIRDPVVLQTLASTAGPLADPFGLLVRENYLPTSSMLIRRECLARSGFMDPALRLAEDYDLWIRLALAGCQFGFVNTVLCHRRLHGGNLVNQRTALTAAGAAVLARYVDRVPDQRAAAAQLLDAMYYDLGSQYLKQREFGRALHYLRQSHPSGLNGFIRSMKLAVAWVCLPTGLRNHIKQ